eukprot:6975864-Prymnesium_polylepis.1
MSSKASPIFRRLAPRYFGYLPSKRWQGWLMVLLMLTFAASFLTLSTFSAVLLAQLSLQAAILPLLVDCALYLVGRICEGEHETVSGGHAGPAFHLLMNAANWGLMHFCPVFLSFRVPVFAGPHNYSRVVCLSLVGSVVSVAIVLHSSASDDVMRYVATCFCVPAGCTALATAAAVLKLMHPRFRRTFCGYDTRRKLTRDRWSTAVDDPRDKDSAHARHIRTDCRSVELYGNDLAIDWLSGGAARFERTLPVWYTEEWVDALPPSFAGALVLLGGAEQQAGGSPEGSGRSPGSMRASQGPGAGGGVNRAQSERASTQNVAVELDPAGRSEAWPTEAQVQVLGPDCASLYV